MDNFEKYMLDNGLQLNTIQTYLINTQVYLRWHEYTYGLEEPQISKKAIAEFLNVLKDVKMLKNESVAVYIASLRAFSEYRGDTTVIDSVRSPKTQHSFINPSILSEEEVERFRHKMLVETSARNHAITTVMAYAGLRVSEVLNLKIQDIHIRDKSIKVRSGKGDKQRMVFMSDKVADSLSHYLGSGERKTEKDWLFVSNRNKRLHRTTINHLYNKHSKKITPHMLRHFFCTQALEKGKLEIHEVSGLAGHRDVNTTMKYLHPTKETILSKINDM